MKSKQFGIEQSFLDWLLKLGFNLLSEESTGYLFHCERDDTILIVDTVICDQSEISYVSYTSRQNEMMSVHKRVFRFLYENERSFSSIKQEIQLFLSGDFDPEKVKQFGGNRTILEPDPTPPEAAFEDCFLEAFDDKSRMALHREFACVDLAGTKRFIDYALFAHSAKFAIELNGEYYHNPSTIGPNKYRSQLFKQNSLVSDGFKVFRWSLAGMADKERFILELSRFIGPHRPFHNKSIIKLDRSVLTFTLRNHQHLALDKMKEARMKGQNTFLLVLPTGTGKTEIFIEDIVRLKKQTSDLRALIIVPTRKLREQTISRLQLRLPPQYQGSVSVDILNNHDAAFMVQTTAYMQHHYYKISPYRFKCIVVDEAHHAAAQGLRSVLAHFTPNHLIGITATPDRFDQQRLEEIFGEYESQLTLESAIKKGLVPPVRCYRIKSNIDLTEVRFNGREYVKNDLQKTLLIPSRDQLVADVLNSYFGGELETKQGVVFCVDIKHAKRMAAIFMKEGLSAMAVDGRDRKNAIIAQKAYDDGKIRFLCACDLLTEGWDAPQTSILVMARPTFSKVLYVQQLGRGLRNHEGKEALYVIDVVDNYGAKLQPLSLHSLLKIPNYQAFADLLKTDHKALQAEVKILAGLYEGERRIEPVNIFSFAEMYGTFLNEEQLARELFVSTDTVRQWLRKGKITSDIQYPFGRKKIHFFDPKQLDTIREQHGLKEHNEETRVADFSEFLQKRDYTFSYKIVFLLSFFKVCNERFEAVLPDIVVLYQQFYQKVLKKNGKNEKDLSPYNKKDYINDCNCLQQSLLRNPFEKFERKRFFYQCKDLNYLALDPVIIKQITSGFLQEIIGQMDQDLLDYYSKLGIHLSKSDYAFSQEESSGLFVTHPTSKQKYETVLPFYPLSIAAGEFMDSEITNEPDSWFVVEGLTHKRVLSESMFVAQVKGKSMEPRIPDGSFCLFTFDIGGTRNGRIVLAQKSGIFDRDTGASFTVKTYSSTKSSVRDGGWKHKTIILKPINVEYEDIVIPSEDIEDFRVVAFFIEVLFSEEGITSAGL